MNGYDLSRAWFDFCFDNPELINPNHTAIYFFAIEHCNRLGWKRKFGFPSQMTMDALGIKKHQTYIKYFNDIVEWGGFTLIQKSKNQYSANIISINAMPKSGKALDKAFITHAAKQTQSNGQSTGQSNSSVYKQETKNNIYRFNSFYDEQIEKSSNDENYLKMVEFIFGQNPLEKPLKNVLSTEAQISYKNFCSLMAISKEKKVKLLDVLLDFENYKGKKYTSVYLTIRKWMQK